MSLLQTAFTLFLIMDAFGNMPVFLAILKNYDAHRQRVIIFREMIFALIIILFFSFLGEQMLTLMGISQIAVQLAGGVILFLIALQMLFPRHSNHLHAGEEPFIVPLAIPLTAGPSLIGALLIYSRQQADFLMLTEAICMAWLATLLVLLASSWLKKILGNSILSAIENIMGFAMALIAVEMFSVGLMTFLRHGL